MPVTTINLSFSAEETYPLSLASDELSDRIYAHLKDFWFRRHNLELPEEHKYNLIHGYRDSFMAENMKPIREALLSILKARSPGQRFSVLELGCANSPLLHFLKHHVDLGEVDYTGIEPYSMFVDDLKSNFPTAHAMVGNAESFLEMDEAVLGRERFSVFVSTLVFCMIRPDIVRRCLLRVGQLCDKVLIHDYVVNLTGNVSADQPVTFPYNLRTAGQVYFANPFLPFLQEAGFALTGLQEIPHPDGMRGWGVMVAEKTRGGG